MTKKDRSKNEEDNKNNSRASTHRHSLQIDKKARDKMPELRHTQSQYFGNKPRLQLFQSSPTIPEVESEDEDNPNAVKMTVLSEKHRSVSKESVVEKNKKTSVVSKKSSAGSRTGLAFENPSFDGSHTNGNARKVSKISTVSGQFVRGSNNGGSVRSSMHDPSVISMEVQREQYCCCSRWSRCEKRLGIAVAGLAVVIVVLVIVVGYLAGHKGVDQRFSWSF